MAKVSSGQYSLRFAVLAFLIVGTLIGLFLRTIVVSRMEWQRLQAKRMEAQDAMKKRSELVAKVLKSDLGIPWDNYASHTTQGSGGSSSFGMKAGEWERHFFHGRESSWVVNVEVRGIVDNFRHSPISIRTQGTTENRKYIKALVDLFEEQGWEYEVQENGTKLDWSKIAEEDAAVVP